MTRGLVRPAGVSRNLRSRLAVLAACAAALVGVLYPIAPADAHYAVQAKTWAVDRFGSGCGSQLTSSGAWFYQKPCSINFTKSTLLGPHGVSAAADAASGNWNGLSDPQRGVPVFGYAGYTSGPQQVYMGVEDLGSSADGVTLGRATSTSTCSASPARCYFTGVTIRMTTNSMANWFVSSAESYDLPSGKNDWQAVATHELGHAMGLMHQQKTASGIHTMGACAPAGGTEQDNLPGSHDRAGLWYLYGGRNSSAHGFPSDALPNCKDIP